MSQIPMPIQFRVLLSVCLPLVLVPAAAPALRPEGAPVILERDVTFVTDAGESVLLPEGNYYVRVGQEPPLVVAAEYEERGFALAAVLGQHAETLEEPYAESISGGEDEHHLILLLEDGRSIDATGTYSGVATRDVTPLDPKSVASYREAWAQWPPPGVTERSGELSPLPPPRPPEEAAWSEGFHRDLVIVKFKEGAAVRVPEVVTRSGERPSLDLDDRLMGRMERSDRLERVALTPQQVEADLAEVNRILAGESIEAWVPLVDRPERFMEAERLAAERRSAEQHGDLGNTYAIKVRAGGDAVAIANQLNQIASVEVAYLAPIPQDADLPPPTPDWQGSQGYLKPSPQGIDAEYAWTKPGGKGLGVWVIDVEQSWQLDHEDLPARYAPLNDPGGAQQGNGQHGVAVMGEIVAKPDGHGVTGIANQGKFNVAPVNRRRSSGAWFWEQTWTERNVAEAITVAASKLRRGDVILIEQHYPSGKASGSCPAACGNCSQWGYVAMEYFLPEYIAMRLATARGIHVVEAAGNGGMDLDHARYEQRFSRDFRDSETIMVGASDAALRPECWSNHGSRVDVHGWGRNIMTLGYGDQKVTGAPAADKKQWYTRTFGGTSGASPIVTGAVMAIVGAQKAAGQVLLSPRQMRTLLASTGTAQLGYQPPSGMPAQTRNIGPLPDLKRALDRQIPPASGSP